MFPTNRNIPLWWRLRIMWWDSGRTAPQLLWGITGGDSVISAAGVRSSKSRRVGIIQWGSSPIIRCLPWDRAFRGSGPGLKTGWTSSRSLQAGIIRWGLCPMAPWPPRAPWDTIKVSVMWATGQTWCRSRQAGCTRWGLSPTTLRWLWDTTTGGSVMSTTGQTS